MIVTCPQCEDQFSVPVDMIGAQGRKVKCSSCSEVWTQMPEETPQNVDDSAQVSDIPDAVKPQQDDDAISKTEGKADFVQDGLFSKRAIGGYLAAFVAFLLVLIILMSAKATVIKTFPSSISFYKMFGSKVQGLGESLVFDRLHSEITGKQQITLKGYIVNLSNIKQKLPMIRAIAYDKDKNIVANWNIETHEKIIDPEGSVSVQSVYDGDISNIMNVEFHFVLSQKTHKKWPSLIR